MNEIEFLNKKLTTEELDNFLYEIMGYHVIPAEHITRYYKVAILDEEGDYVSYEDLIGIKDISIVKNALLFKEKIDERRGEERGRYDVQMSIKQALGINV